jgi:NhaP-type Na+/H+ or K+/H+ antiporter
LFNFLISSVIATTVAFVFYSDLEFISAMFFGVIVAGTSSAIVIPMLQQIKADEGTTTYLVLESALSDVFCLVIGLALFDSLAAGSIDIGSIGGSIAKAFFIATIIGLVFGYLWSIVLNLIRDLQNHILINLGMLFIIYGLSEYFSLNGGIASLAFGFALGNSYLLPSGVFSQRWKPKPLMHEEKLLFSELVFVLATFFFVYVGINIVFANPSIYVASFIIVALILILRPWAVKYSIYSKHSVRDLGMMSVMAPKGIVPAILAALPLQLGMQRKSEFLIVQGEIIQNLTFSIILLSIVICSGLVIYISSKKDGMWYMKKFFAAKIQTAEDLAPGEDDKIYDLMEPAANDEEQDNG